LVDHGAVQRLEAALFRWREVVGKSESLELLQRAARMLELGLDL
jgi:hypothetical protein